MRYPWLALAGLLLCSLSAGAQQPPQPPAPALDPGRDRLDAMLLRWEKEMTSIESLTAQITQTEKDKAFQDTKTFVGTAKYKRPNFALLDIQNKKKPDDYKKYICSGTFLYEYATQQKEIRVHQLPPPKPGQVADDNFLSFLFGMKAVEAKRRYDLKLVKEDQWYLYVEVLPRYPADLQDFKRARLVLNKDNYLPRQLWFEQQPNGNEVTWEIEKIDSKTPLDRKQFEAPAVPPGWRMTQVPRVDSAVPPRVVRPQQ